MNGGFVSGLFRSRDQKTGLSGTQSLSAAQASTTTTGPRRKERINLQKPRHSGLFEAVHRLDAQIDEAGRRELAAWITDQYATDYGDVPLGFLARCYLGPPYVDHRLDLLASIVEHFQPADAVPAPFDRARVLARLSSYEYIEVYGSGTLVPVRVDGSVDVPIGGPHG
jgi:hypothetical protein